MRSWRGSRRKPDVLNKHVGLTLGRSPPVPLGSRDLPRSCQPDQRTRPMRYGLIIAGITIGWTLAGPVRAAATPRENTSKDRLFRQTIQAGIAYLRNAQQADGSWEIYQV